MIHKQTVLNKNPSENANIFSRICYWWLIKIYYKGATRDLEMTDLYEPTRCERSEVLGDQLEREWQKELAKTKIDQATKRKQKSYQKPSLLKCIIRIYFWSSLFQGFLMFVENVILLILRTTFLGWLILYFDPGSVITKQEVYCYATGIVVTTIITIMVTSIAHFEAARIGMKIRIGCSSLVYRKILRLSKTSLDQTTGGQIVNLLSNDAKRFDFLPAYFHYLWIMPIQMTMISYFIWQDVGIATLAGVAACTLQTIPVQGYISRLSVRLRKQIAEQTDKRIQVMNELISSIQVVKMYGWEKSFERIVYSIRAMEMKLISLACYCSGFYLNTAVFTARVTVFVTLTTLVLIGDSVNAKMVFTMSAYWKILELLLTFYFPLAIVSTGEALISFRRIEEYLQLEEQQPELKNALNKVDPSNNENGITIRNLSANWIYGALPPTLYNLSLKVNQGKLCALVGSVGSGKSSILQLILGELSAATGTLDIGGKTISYAAQDAWLFGGTIRDNILFGLPYAKGKYDEVIKVCALDTDLQQLPQGHLTMVGERGISLSGGQRARINLARAVYRDADLYLLDDPLSAVDTHVGRQLFKECINGYLREKTRILVTHQLQYLKYADTIVVLKNGYVEIQDTWENLISSNTVLYNLANSFQIKEDEPKAIGESFRSTVSVNKSSDREMEILDEEEVAKGRMSLDVYKRYLKAGGGICLRSFILITIILTQAATSGIDYWLTFWTNQEALKLSHNFTGFVPNSSRFENQLGGWNAVNASDPWTYSELDNQYTTTTSIVIYAGIILSCVLFSLVRSTLFLRMCINSNKALHRLMFENLTQTTMRFFNTNPSGRILNRFSKDIGAMDEMLPKSMLEVIAVLSAVLGSLAMVIAGNYWMMIPTAIFGTICYAARNSYLSIAQCISRLEGVAKSPVFSHVNYSLNGLSTIKSSRAELRMIRKFDDCQDFHTSTSFINLATSHAFTFYLNSLVTVLITIVCFTFIILDDENTKSGDVGLAVSQSIGLTEIIQFGIKKSVQMVSEMTSTERVLQYINLPKEGPFESNGTSKPPLNWPRLGVIDIQNLSLRYDEKESDVLKNITIHISHGQKVGIIGRTGAGKSSLVAALFRLVSFRGSVKIDGVDIQTIGLHDLRSKMSIIPQQPTLFRATLRYNLDPFNEITDDYLWAALAEVELKEAFTSLDYEVNEGGSNLSLGERQLVCLARAILKNNKIVILDEATANLDSRTDALIQATIRRKFADCTVISIAHRISTIMDNDRIIVLDAGRLVEFGDPRNLLENPDGYFTRMVKGTNTKIAEKFTKPV